MNAVAPEPLFAVREYRPETDKAFVVSAWLANNRHSPATMGINGKVYLEGERAKIDRLLIAYDVAVAHAPEDEEALLGFACTGPRPVIHYVYVRASARRLGIARSLLARFVGKKCWRTHLPVMRGLMVPSEWVYNPYLLSSP